MKLSIVIPVYNEGDSIEKVIRVLEAFVRMDHELVIVYDFDDDDDCPVVRSLQGEFPAARLHKNEFGRGVVSGFKAARGDYVCLFTGDCTDQPEAIPKMVDLMDRGYDLVSGSRYIRGGVKYGGPWLQTQFSYWGNILFQRFTGLPLHDITYSFKLYRREVLQTCAPKYDAGWVVSLDLGIQAALRGYRMAEIPTMWIDRQIGESKFQMQRWLPIYLKLFFSGVRQLRRWRKENGDIWGTPHYKS